MQYFLRRNSHIIQRPQRARLSINDVQFSSKQAKQRSNSSVDLNQCPSNIQHQNYPKTQSKFDDRNLFPSIFRSNQTVILQGYSSKQSKPFLKRSSSEVKVKLNSQAVDQTYKFLSKRRFQDQKTRNNDSLLLHTNEKQVKPVLKPKLSHVNHNKILKQSLFQRQKVSLPNELISRKLTSVKLPEMQRYSLLYNFNIQKSLLKMSQRNPSINKLRTKGQQTDPHKQQIVGWNIQNEQDNQKYQLDQIFENQIRF